MSMKSLPPHTPLLYSKTGVYRGYLFFLFFVPKIDCGYSLEPPQRGSSNVYPQSIFEQTYQRGGLTLYEIYIGFCPRTNFYNIMHIACLVHDHFISNIDFHLTT